MKDYEKPGLEIEPIEVEQPILMGSDLDINDDEEADPKYDQLF